MSDPIMIQLEAEPNPLTCDQARDQARLAVGLLSLLPSQVIDELPLSESQANQLRSVRHVNDGLGEVAYILRGGALESLRSRGRLLASSNPIDDIGAPTCCHCSSSPSSPHAILARKASVERGRSA